MTSSQDPNQPGQPGAPEPGWGSPPPATPPAWGPPPPGYPPQPDYPPQPGYPPPPGYQPPTGWGYPPQPGWGPPGYPPARTSNNRGCLIAVLALFAVLLVGVGSCAWLIAPIVGTDIKLQQELGPRADSVGFNWVNGEVTFTVHLVPGQNATDVACNIVRPIIRDSSTPNAHFEIFEAFSTRSGPDATELTPCP